MNYLSHLYFSKRTPLSMTGNLMGDFKPDKALRDRLPEQIVLGIRNHRLVDRKTDRFTPVKELREVFSPPRRRYAGIVTDIAFDYFLIKHWTQFESQQFPDFVENCYAGLSECHDWMPSRMSFVAEKMQEHNWLSAYGTMDGVSRSIDMVSKRLRFDNNMAGSVVEIENNYQQIEAVFMELFSHLENAVTEANVEG